jgi:hypothetical protein
VTNFLRKCFHWGTLLVGSMIGTANLIRDSELWLLSDLPWEPSPIGPTMSPIPPFVSVPSSA